MNTHHKARTTAEKEYLKEIKQIAKEHNFKKKDVSIEFCDGNLGLDVMDFPYWKVTIENRSKVFNDQVKYGRRFGDTSFRNCISNRKIVIEWIEEISKEN